MTPEERQLLTSLADRIKSAPTQDRDAEADQAIADLVRARPDTTYILAQTVLMQDFALRNAQAQIADLQRQLQAAQQAAQSQPKSAGFLSGLFGSGGSQPQPQPQSQYAPGGSVPPANPWGRPVAQPQPTYAPQQTAYASPGYAPVVMQPSQTSGFLRDAATTAVGVAGGALLFEGIQSLFSHPGYGGFGGGGFGGGGFGGGFGGPMGGFGGGFEPRESLSETTIVNNNYTDSNNNTYDSDNSYGGHDGQHAADQPVDTNYQPSNPGYEPDPSLLDPDVNLGNSADQGSVQNTDFDTDSGGFDTGGDSGGGNDDYA